MATRSLSSRLKELYPMYTKQIGKVFEARRTVLSKPFNKALDTELSRLKSEIERRLTEIFEAPVFVEIYTSHRSDGRYIEGSFRLNESTTHLGSLRSESKTCLQPVCLEERACFAALEEWKERCLLSNEIVPFIVPPMPEEYEQMRCES